jgi:DNA-directed RNA polymerase specialized sigma24 family protein
VWCCEPASIRNGCRCAGSSSRARWILAAVPRPSGRGRQRVGLSLDSGDPRTNALLDDIAPALADLLGDLTKRQRAVARLLLVDGLRRSEAAVALNVTRATVSVAAERAHVRSIGRLASVLSRMLGYGAARAAGGPGG